MVNVPGYATFGSTEPYHINDFDKIRSPTGWPKHHFDWKLVEKNGGHEIFNDELPKIGDFLMAHPRNLYRSRVYGVSGTSVVFNDAEHVQITSGTRAHLESRPADPLSTIHWLRLYPLAERYAKGEVAAADLGGKPGRQPHQDHVAERPPACGSISIRRWSIFPSRSRCVANGKTVFNGKVTPDLKTMLELVREFDDRGRIFYAAIDVDIPTDTAVMPEPQGDAGQPAGHS